MYLATHRHALTQQTDRNQINLFIQSGLSSIGNLTMLDRPGSFPDLQKHPMPHWSSPLLIETYGVFGGPGNQFTPAPNYYFQVDEGGDYTVRLTGQIAAIVDSSPAEGTQGFEIYNNAIGYDETPVGPSFSYGRKTYEVVAPRNVRPLQGAGGANILPFPELGLTLGPGGFQPPDGQGISNVGIHYQVATSALVGTNIYTVEFDCLRRISITDDERNFRIVSLRGQPGGATGIHLRMSISNDALS